MKKKKYLLIIILLLLLSLIIIFFIRKNDKIIITFIDNNQIIKEIKTKKGDVISLPKLTSDNYKFDGWLYKEKVLTNNAWFNENATVVAKWSEKPPVMTINFDTDGGIDLKSIMVECNSSLKLPIPIKKGYQFISWIDSEDKEINDNTELKCQNITLKAKWIKKETNTIFTNLDDTLKNVGITKTYHEYNPSKDAITIYLFYGKTCIHCHNFLSFLNDIVPEYGKYFNLEAYEVWNNDDNKNLFNEVLSFQNKDNTSVPHIIIGENILKGYNKNNNEDIIYLITKLYNTNILDRYDIMQEIDK